ncbi:hypothetical protein KDA00_05800 [Candidatus Saccharibacteria bacterium]|nr:hypothetical protein [Candidatus Saccharibacteria bacterium]
MQPEDKSSDLTSNQDNINSIEPTVITPNMSNSVQTPAAQNSTQSGGSSTVLTPPTPPSSTVNSTAKNNIFSKFSKMGKMPIIIIALVLILGGSAGAYFGVILPNNPEYLWKKSLSNSAKGLDKAVEYQKNKGEVNGYKFSGNFKGEFQQALIDGNFEGTTYKGDADIKADFGAAGSRMNLEILAETPENADYPDLYVRVKGLEALGSILGASDPEVSQIFSTINNQWYTIDHTLFSQISSSSKSNDSKSPTDLTPDEINQVLIAISDTTSQYLFSTETDKAVLVVQEKVGAEEVDGRKMYHYKVSINKENYKEYLNALKDALKATPLTKVSGLEDLDKPFESMVKAADNLDESETADVWVDKSTKLLRKVRFSDKENSNNYVEISLNYDGGKTYPLQIFAQSGDSGSKAMFDMTLSLNTESNETSLDAKFQAGEGKDQSKIELSMKQQDNNEQLNITKPADAKSIYELIGSFYGGSPSPVGGDDFAPIPPLTPDTLGIFDIRNL